MLQAFAVPDPSPCVRALQHCLSPLEQDDHAALASLGPFHTIDKFPRCDIAREGEHAGIIRVLVAGWGFRYKDLPDGRRQIIGFLLPGDFTSYSPHIPQPLDHSIGALTKVSYCELRSDNLRHLIAARPHIARALQTRELALTGMQRQWLLSIGQRSPVERLAHLFVELYYRLSAIGLVQGTSFHFPITQTQLAEANGLSPVHVQRTLQEMRRDGLIALADRQLAIVDLDRLKRIAMFDGGYLQLGAI